MQTHTHTHTQTHTQAHSHTSVLLWCSRVLWRLFFMFVCVLVFVFLREWVKRTKGIVEQDRDLAGVGGGGSLSAVRCPPLLCSPSCEDHVCTLARAPRQPERQNRLTPVWTQVQVEIIKACSVSEWVKKRRLRSFDDRRERTTTSVSVFSVCTQGSQRVVSEI